MHIPKRIQRNCAYSGFSSPSWIAGVSAGTGLEDSGFLLSSEKILWRIPQRSFSGSFAGPVGMEDTDEFEGISAGSLEGQANSSFG